MEKWAFKIVWWQNLLIRHCWTLGKETVRRSWFEKEKKSSDKQKMRISEHASMFGMYTYYMTIQVCYDKKTPWGRAPAPLQRTQQADVQWDMIVKAATQRGKPVQAERISKDWLLHERRMSMKRQAARSLPGDVLTLQQASIKTPTSYYKIK